MTPLACELTVFVLIFRMSHKMLQLVLRDTLAVLHSILNHENDRVSKATPYSLWEKFPKNEKDENSSPKAQALPIKQPRFPTAGHIVVSKNRALYSLCV